jgi:hypothetical protein
MREDITNTIEYHKGASDSFPGQGGSQQGFGPSKLGAQNCLCRQEAKAVVQQISTAFVAPYSLLTFASSLETLVDLSGYHVPGKIVSGEEAVA